MQREIFSQITEPRVHHLYVIPDNFLSSLILKEKKKKKNGKLSRDFQRHIQRKDRINYNKSKINDYFLLENKYFHLGQYFSIRFQFNDVDDLLQRWYRKREKKNLKFTHIRHACSRVSHIVQYSYELVHGNKIICTFLPDKWNKSVMRAVCIRKRVDGEGRGSHTREQRRERILALVTFSVFSRKVAFTSCRSKDRTAQVAVRTSRKRVRTTSFRRRSRVDSSESIHPIVRPNNGHTPVTRGFPLLAVVQPFWRLLTVSRIILVTALNGFEFSISFLTSWATDAFAVLWSFAKKRRFDRIFIGRNLSNRAKIVCWRKHNSSKKKSKIRARRKIIAFDRDRLSGFINSKRSIFHRNS